VPGREFVKRWVELKRASEQKWWGEEAGHNYTRRVVVRLNGTKEHPRGGNETEV